MEVKDDLFQILTGQSCPIVISVFEEGSLLVGITEESFGKFVIEAGIFTAIDNKGWINRLLFNGGGAEKQALQLGGVIEQIQFPGGCRCWEAGGWERCI